MRVKGNAEARLLPVPFLTLNDVEIGSPDGVPITIAQVALHVELGGLMSGEVHVVDVAIDRPRLRATIDVDGQMVLPQLAGNGGAVDFAKVSLSGATVAHGEILIADRRTGAEFGLTEINLSRLEARSLAGPWRIEGSLLAGGVPLALRASTAKPQANGDLAVSIDLTASAGAPVVGTLALEGVLKFAEGEPAFLGRYAFGKPTASSQRANAAPTFQSEGGIRLDARQLLLADFSVGNWLSQPRRTADQVNDLSGDLALVFGAQPRFDAVIRARQIDLDRSFGEGPARPAKVGDALAQIAGAAAAWPKLGVPGSLAVDVPGVVVGGGMIQGLKLEGETDGSVWTLSRLDAVMPGKTTLAAKGRLTTSGAIAFQGEIRAASERPAAFAAWWRGSEDAGAARRLAAFDLAGRVRIGGDQIVLEGATAHLEGAALSGQAQIALRAGGRTSLEIAAARLDLDRIAAVGDLLREAGLPADLSANVQMRIKAQEVVAGPITAADVTFDATLAKGDLSVREATVGNLAGVRIALMPGEFAGVFTSPRGRLTADVSAASLMPLLEVLDRVAPDFEGGAWLRRAALDLAPARLSLQASRLAQDGSLGVVVSGNAAGSGIAATIALEAPVWPPAAAGRLSVILDAAAEDAAVLGRQFGIESLGDVRRGPGELRFRAAGMRAEGYAADLRVTAPGADLRYSGMIDLKDLSAPRLSGALDLTAENAGLLLAPFGAAWRDGGAVKASGSLTASRGAIDLRIASGTAGGRSFSGRLALKRDVKSWVVDAALEAERVDIGALAQLGFGGMAGVPGNDPLLSRTPFGAPALGTLRGDVALKVGRLDLVGGVAATATTLSAAVQPGSVGIRLERGDLAGGTATGDLLIRNESGEALVSGQIAVTGANVERLAPIWGGGAVLTGRSDLLASFTASGRSMADLAGSAAGSGSLTIRGGAVRGLGIGGVPEIVRISDAGTEFTDTDLAQRLGDAIAETSVGFDEVVAPFRVAGGKVTFDFVPIDTDRVARLNSAVLDLATLSLRSDWTISANDPQLAVGTSLPQVDVVIEGPLGGPNRRIRSFRFASYLQIRTADQQQRTADLLRAGIDAAKTGATAPTEEPAPP